MYVALEEMLVALMLMYKILHLAEYQNYNLLVVKRYLEV